MEGAWAWVLALELELELMDQKVLGLRFEGKSCKVRLGEWSSTLNLAREDQKTSKRLKPLDDEVPFGMVPWSSSTNLGVWVKTHID